MLPIARAEMLKHEADSIMDLLKLNEILDRYGEWNLTGSYALNVMVYPDLDIYLNLVGLPRLFEIGTQIATCEFVSQLVCEPSSDPVNLPGGLYLKARIKYGDWGRPWKIDLWSLPNDVMLNKNAQMSHFLQKITLELRQQIIEYKLSIMTAEKRTPMYSGYYIYKAFIDEGMTDFDEITAYLMANGIRVQNRE